MQLYLTASAGRVVIQSPYQYGYKGSSVATYDESLTMYCYIPAFTPYWLTTNHVWTVAARLYVGSYISGGDYIWSGLRYGGVATNLTKTTFSEVPNPSEYWHYAQPVYAMAPTISNLNTIVMQIVGTSSSVDGNFAQVNPTYNGNNVQFFYGPPDALSVANLDSPTQISLTFDHTGDGLTPIDSWSLYRSENGGSTYSILYSGTGTPTGYTDNSISTGNNYIYKWTLTNTDGNNDVFTNEISLGGNASYFFFF